MKNTFLKSITLATTIILFSLNFALCQNFINYQGVVLDNDAKPLSEEFITITISINDPEYIYTTDAQTSILGAFSVQIPVDEVDFTKDIDYILKSSISTPNGTIVNESPMTAVPRALVAEQAKSLVGITELDESSTNELQSLSIEGNQLTISDGNTINLPNMGGNGDGDNDPNNEVQTLTVSQNNNEITIGLSLTGENINFDISDLDSDDKNEIQSLIIDNNSLVLSGATGNSSSISLSSLGDGTEDADADPSNEIQTISKSGNLVTLSNSGGSFIDEVNDGDADAENELQELSISGNSLTISDGNSVNIPNEDADADPSNELQELTWTGTKLKISGGNEVDLPDESYTNELQNLFLSGTQLGLTMSASQIDMSQFVNTSPWSYIEENGPDISFIGGKVAIGTVDPLYDLDVDGTIRATGEMVVYENLFAEGNLSVGQDLFTNEVTAYGDINAFDNIRLNGTNKLIMQGDYNLYSDGSSLRFDGDVLPHNVNWDLGNNVSGEHWDDVVADDIILFSDRRLKKGITNLESVLSKVMILNPVTYKYLESHSRDNRSRTGLIAQELLDVFPNAVITEDVDVDIHTGDVIRKPVGYLGINYLELVPITIKAIQEQQTIIDSQNQEIGQLKEELKSINTMLEKLMNK